MSPFGDSLSECPPPCRDSTSRPEDSKSQTQAQLTKYTHYTINLANHSIFHKHINECKNAFNITAICVNQMFFSNVSWKWISLYQTHSNNLYCTTYHNKKKKRE